MPSENMVIPVMMFLRQIKSFDRMNEEQRQFLEYWYWAPVFSNRYSGSSNETIITDSTVLRQVAQFIGRREESQRREPDGVAKVV